MEVQLGVGGEAEAEADSDTLKNPSCNPGCSCVCHLQRPGMKLIWVLEDVEYSLSGDDDDDTDLDVGSGEEEEVLEEEKGEVVEVERESEVGNDKTSVADENELVKQKKKFHHTLDVLMSESNRRRSDPGPPSVLTSLAVVRSQSPPVPPKRTQSPSVNYKDDDNIYESVLPMSNPPPKKTPPVFKESAVPLINVVKPPRRSKLINSISDPSDSQGNSDAVSNPAEMPPAVPPRMPMSQSTLTPLHRGAIPLPQPTKEEWRTLLPSSHSSSTSTPPSTSPLVPQRPPPPPPKTDPRRLSSASMQSLSRKGSYLATHHENIVPFFVQ